MQRILGQIPIQLRLVAIGLIASQLLAACATPLVRNPVPNVQMAQKAEVANLPGIRAWADEVPDDPIAEIARRTPHMPRVGQSAGRAGGRPVVETLALSGGGSDGAFGAGVLNGWTERGDRPEFEIVTGVSAGAIIAPFAFLGPQYDDVLREIWTQYQASDVVTASILPGLFGGPALADTTPLARLIERYVQPQVLDAIAKEYERGRILLVLTTNLDAQRPVVWNMGEIARNGSPEALELFRNVIRASSAIPGAFPPVKIEVNVDGKVYDELHVDGGTTREVFVLPVQAPFRAFDRLYKRRPVRRVFLIKNGKVTPEYETVKPTTLKIASRSISTLIKTQNWSELYRIYRLAKDDQVDFNLLAVPKTFTLTTEEFYDPKYQKALFKQGREMGRAGAWMKSPPGQTPLEPRMLSKARKKSRSKSVSKPPKRVDDSSNRKAKTKTAPKVADDEPAFIPRYTPPTGPSAWQSGTSTTASVD